MPRGREMWALRKLKSWRAHYATALAPSPQSKGLGAASREIVACDTFERPPTACRNLLARNRIHSCRASSCPPSPPTDPAEPPGSGPIEARARGLLSPAAAGRFHALQATSMLRAEIPKPLNRLLIAHSSSGRVNDADEGRGSATDAASRSSLGARISIGAVATCAALRSVRVDHSMLKCRRTEQ